MKKDVWDKLKIIGGLFGGILVPAAIYFGSIHISDSSSDADRLTTLIEHLSSSNPDQQRVALEVASILQANGDLPSGFEKTLERIANTTPYAATAVAGTTLVDKIVNQQSDSNSTTLNSESEKDTITYPPRVYFHISDASQRQDAKNLERELQSLVSDFSVVIPGIELIPGPRVSELRYFKADEKDVGEVIAAALQQTIPDIKLVNLAELYPDAKIRPYHYELWLSTNAFDDD